ncbi:hypothetical protein ACP70R_020095 [Stipagrostis hirtigluma subsp. patula]
MPKQSAPQPHADADDVSDFGPDEEARMALAAVEARCRRRPEAQALPPPLSGADIAAIEPFARLVSLVGRLLYDGVVFQGGELTTGGGPSAGLAVTVLDTLTRYAWVEEKSLAKMLQVKEKALLLLLQQFEKDKLLKRESLKRGRVKTAVDSGQECIRAGSFCSLDYSQICDGTRYRLHRMKKAVQDKLDTRNAIEEYICPVCQRRYSALDASNLVSDTGDSFQCENCKGELVSQIGDFGTQKKRRVELVDTLKEQMSPFQSQLELLSNMPIPCFGSLQEWKETNAVKYVVDSSSNIQPTLGPFLGQVQVEIASSNADAKGEGVKSEPNLVGAKVLPTWLVLKGMTRTKAEGRQGPHEEERLVGTKSKRNDSSHGDSVESSSIRRRV